MKVLLVRPLLEWGGASISIFRLAGSLRDMGHDPLIATAGGDLYARAHALGLSVIHIPLHPSRPVQLLKSTLALRALVNREGIDLIHSHHRFSNLMCRAVSQLTGTPMVVTVNEFKHNLRFLTRLGLPQHVVTYSRALKDHLTAHYQVPARVIRVVEMGVRERDRVLVQNGARADPGKPHQIGCFARLSEEKGVATLLQAIHNLKANTQTEVEVVIIGDGPQRPDLEALARTLAIAEQVRFLGWVDEIETVLPEVDFLVLPSQTEGFGLIIIEGLFHQKPTIGTRVGSIPELIQHDRNGLLVPVDDPLTLAEAIRTLVEEPDKTRRLGEAGQREISDRYSVEAMGNQMVQIYLSALDQMR